MGIVKFMQNRISRLIFSLISGAAYFAAAFWLCRVYFGESSGLIVFFFAPALICGAALVLFKSISSMLEQENKRGIVFLTAAHTVFVIVTAVLLIAAAVTR